MLFGIIRSELEILQPETLRNDVHAGDSTPHLIDYSVSMFGEILYNQKFVVQVVYPGDDNVNGCNTLKTPEGLASTKYVWLLKRGDCTYSKKAYSVQQSGAIAALVYHDDPTAIATNIIPCGDSVCRLKRQQYPDSNNPDQQQGRTSDPRVYQEDQPSHHEFPDRPSMIISQAVMPCFQMWTSGCRPPL